MDGGIVKGVKGVCGADILAAIVGFVGAIGILIWITRHNHGADND